MTNFTPKQNEFIESVVSLQPRVATFDCDGTLWAGDAGEGFFSWELDSGFVSEEVRRWARPRYADYRAGNVAEEVMCGEMVTMHRGMREDIVQQAAEKYFSDFASNIFAEMEELVRRLRQSGCDVWAVSSTNVWVIRAAVPHFGIPEDRIIAAEVAVENGIVTDRLLRVPSGPGKSEAIHDRLKTSPDCAFGNSIWDREMLEMARRPFAINPNADLKAMAEKRGWGVYEPDGIQQGR